MRFTCKMHCPGSKKPNIGSSTWNIQRLSQGLWVCHYPHFQRLQACPDHDQSNRPVAEVSKSFFNRHSRPYRKCLPRGLNCFFHIMLIGIRDNAVNLSFRWIIIVNILAIDRLNQCSVDIIQNLNHRSGYKLPVLPPSTGKLMPLIYPAAGEAKKATAAATSYDSAILLCWNFRNHFLLQLFKGFS